MEAVYNLVQEGSIVIISMSHTALHNSPTLKTVKLKDG